CDVPGRLPHLSVKGFPISPRSFWILFSLWSDPDRAASSFGGGSRRLVCGRCSVLVVPPPVFPSRGVAFFTFCPAIGSAAECGASLSPFQGRSAADNLMRSGYPVGGTASARRSETSLSTRTSIQKAASSALTAAVVPTVELRQTSGA
ncbi:MAG: hypothetical protein QG597_3474, partial [Actinomycetota bacterium]|nr:hypothetical protein [Actinomycetota bacterium]